MGIPSPRASVTALWGPKALNDVVDIDLSFEVEKEQNALHHLQRYWQSVQLANYLDERLGAISINLHRLLM